MWATRAYVSGSCLRSQSSFGAVKPVSARLPVSAISRSRPIRSSISAHSAAVRWSFQRIAGRSGRPSSPRTRSEEHTSNSSHANNSYAVFCLKKKIHVPSLDIQHSLVREMQKAYEERHQKLFFEYYCDLRDLHSFPTRRSSE